MQLYEYLDSMPHCSVEYRKCKSGLELCAVQTENRASAGFGVFVKFGSNHEHGDILPGSAHFIEHMIFKGSEKYSSQDISNIIDYAGGGFNAFTTHEYTCFYLLTMVNNLWDHIDIIVDIVANPAFKKGDFNTEKSVVIEEIKTGFSMIEGKLEYVFGKHFWGRNKLSVPISGEISDVEHIKLCDLQRIHKKFYNDHNILLIVVSRLDPNFVLDKLEYRYANSFSTGEAMWDEMVRFDSLSLSSQGSAIITQQKAKQQVWATFGVLAAPYTRFQEYFPTILLNVILGENCSSLLYQSIREKLGAVYSIQSSYEAYVDIGEVSIQFSSDEEKSDICTNAVKDILYNLPSCITPENVLGAQQYEIASFIMGLDSTHKMLFWIGEEMLHMGRIFSPREYVAAILSVQVEQVVKLSFEFCNFEKWKGVMISNVY